MAGVLRLELRLVVLETIVLTIDTIPLYSLINIYVSIFYSIFQYKIEISSCFFVLDTVYYYLEDCRIRSFYATFILSNLFISYDTGYLRINSYFGKRTSPTQGASSYHKGIDIGAPEGAKLVAICDGTITFADFLRWWWLYPNLNP